MQKSSLKIEPKAVFRLHFHPKYLFLFSLLRSDPYIVRSDPYIVLRGSLEGSSPPSV